MPRILAAKISIRAPAGFLPQLGMPRILAAKSSIHAPAGLSGLPASISINRGLFRVLLRVKRHRVLQRICTTTNAVHEHGPPHQGD